MEKKKAHWLAPTIMVSAFIAGLLIALGHHVFYDSLEQRTVPTGSYSFSGRKLSKQQFNSSVGIAFAFLVKTFLCISVAVGYTQLFWTNIVNADRSPSLVELDWAYGILSNVFLFLNPKHSRRHPFMLLVALVFWCVPFATIFPPATLSVEGVYRTSSSMLPVPQPDFATFNFAEAQSLYPINWTRHPSLPLQRFAERVMMQGQIPPISPPALNASWALDFWGPALQCNDVPATKRDKIWTNMWNAYNWTEGISYVYLSWVPWDSPNATWSEIFESEDGSRGLPFIFDVPGKCAGPLEDSLSQFGPASIYLAVLPKSQEFLIQLDSASLSGKSEPWAIFDHDVMAYRWRRLQNISDTLSPWNASSLARSPSSLYENSTLLRCDLMNTSYTVDFYYLSGATSTKITTNETDQFIRYTNKDQPLELQQDCGTNFTDVYHHFNHKPSCNLNLEAVRLLSYQNIMNAFKKMITGAIYTGPSSPTYNSTIMDTVLAETTELAFLADLGSNGGAGSSQGAGAQDTQDSIRIALSYPGTINLKPPDVRGPLKLMLEQLFQNLTVSLLTDPHFQPNYSSPYAPPERVNVTLDTYQNIYRYDRVTLWISYGISIAFAFVVVIAGIMTIVWSGKSFTSDFSSIVRVARTADLSVEVLDSVGSGADPLPPYLRNARLKVCGKTSRTVKVRRASLNVPLSKRKTW